MALLGHYRFKLVFGDNSNYALLGRGALHGLSTIQFVPSADVSNACLLEIGDFAEIGGSVKIVVGADHPNSNPINVAFGSMPVLRGLSQMGAEKLPLLASTRPIKIGANVTLSENVTVLSGAEIGDGAVIGASALVRGKIEPWSISAGVPARHLRHRFDMQTRELMADIRWWDLTISAFLARWPAINACSITRESIGREEYYATTARIVIRRSSAAATSKEVQIIGVEDGGRFTPLDQCPEAIRNYIALCGSPETTFTVIEDIFAA